MRFEIKIFFSFFILFIYFIQTVGWNDYSIIDLVQSITTQNRFEIDSYYNNTGDRSYYNGHYYSDKAPGVSFLGTPTYYAWKFTYDTLLQRDSFPQKVEYATNKIIKTDSRETKTYEPINPGTLYLSSISILIITVSSLPSALTVILIYKISRYFLKKEIQRILITITYGLGTIAFIYGTVPFTHALATFLMFFSFYLLFTFKIEKQKIERILLAGLISGFAIAVDYPVGLLSALFIFYVMSFKNKKLFLLFIGFLMVGILPLVLYNFSISGNPLTFVYSFTDSSIRTDVGENLGFTSIPNIFVIYRHLIDPYRGLLFYSPILILSLVGFYWMFKNYKQETLLILLGLIGFLIVFSMRDVNFFDFGSSFGARNYLPILPFLMIPLCFVIKNSRLTLFTLFKILLIISVFNNIIGLQNWEWAIGDTYSVYIAQQYRSKINSLEVLANPLKNHYFPLFLQNGPRARVIENILKGSQMLEIRQLFSTINPYPFITVIPLILILVGIWYKEFSFQKIFSILKNNPEIIFIPLIWGLVLL